MIPEFDRAKTVHELDRATSVIGVERDARNINIKNSIENIRKLSLGKSVGKYDDNIKTNASRTGVSE
jgi:hypothetical protein